MKCFYHSKDLDGHCSGALIKLEFPECEMIGIDHEDEFPWDTVQHGEKVIMVDFSLQPFDDMLRLNRMCNLIWIDHHKSAMQKYDGRMVLDKANRIHGLRLDGTGACELVWKYLYDTPVPKAVRLLAEYDVWDHSHPNTLTFQYGLRLQKTDPATVEGRLTWTQLLRGKQQEGVMLAIINNGRVAIKYSEQLNEYQCKQAFEGTWEERRYVAVNSSLIGSKLFESVWDPAKHDLMIAFYWTGTQWSVHMYSEIQSDTKGSVDVSEIAVKYGGGGHAGAAGFQCKFLPFMWGAGMIHQPKESV